MACYGFEGAFAEQLKLDGMVLACSVLQVIFYKFSPHGVAYSGNYLSASEFEHYTDMTPRQLST